MIFASFLTFDIIVGFLYLHLDGFLREGQQSFSHITMFINPKLEYVDTERIHMMKQGYFFCSYFSLVGNGMGKRCSGD